MMEGKIYFKKKNLTKTQYEFIEEIGLTEKRYYEIIERLPLYI